MSASALFSDLLHGNFSHAYSRLTDWYNGWPPQLKAFVVKLTDDEGQILWQAAITLLAGAAAGTPITVIADTAWTDLQSKVPSKAKSDLLDALGVLLRASTPATAS